MVDVKCYLREQFLNCSFLVPLFPPSQLISVPTYLDTFDSTISSNTILSWFRAISLAFVSQFIDKESAVVTQPRQELPDTQSQNSLPSFNNFISYVCQNNFITAAKHTPILAMHGKTFLLTA